MENNEFEKWLNKIERHLKITKRISQKTKLSKEHYKSMYDAGMTVREAINASIMDDSHEKQKIRSIWK